MAILNNATSTLYGSGNKNVSDDEIRQFISGAGSNEDIMNAAVKHGVSADQISSAMGGQGGFDQKGIEQYLSSQGINRPAPVNTQRASSTLYGSGNPNVSNKDIQGFINQGASADDILRAATRHGVSADQISSAMGNQGAFESSNVNDFLRERGILRTGTPDPGRTRRTRAPLPDPVTTSGPVVPNPADAQFDYLGFLDRVMRQQAATPQPVQPQMIPTPTPVNVTTPQVRRSTDTIQGQLTNMLQNPDNPLMVQARTRGLQQAGRRGLLNTSMGVSAGESAMLNEAANIAAGDASIYGNRAAMNAAAQNQAAMLDAQQAFQANTQNAANALQSGMFNVGTQADINKFNAGNLLQAGMFGAGTQADLAKFNAANALQAGMFNAETVMQLGMFNTGLQADIGKFNAATAADILNNRESLANSLELGQMDADTRFRIAGIQARAQESEMGASVINNLTQRHAEILRDPNIPAEAKVGMFNQVMDTAMMTFDILDTVKLDRLKQNLSQLSTATTDSGGTGDDVSPIPTNEEPKPITNVTGNTVPAQSVRLLQGINERNNTRVSPKRLVAPNELENVDNPSAVYDPVDTLAKDGALRTGLFLHRQ